MDRIPFFCLAFCFFFCYYINASFGCEIPDTSAKRLTAAATVSINSNGIASIPAFSLDNPAIIAAPVLTKGRFSYEPVLAYSLELKPWFIDNWLHYKIIDRSRFMLRTGFNASTFFSVYKLLTAIFFRVKGILHLSLPESGRSLPTTWLLLHTGAITAWKKGLTAALSGTPFAIFFQATQAISSNIEPWPGFRWNVGLSYTF